MKRRDDTRRVEIPAQHGNLPALSEQIENVEALGAVTQLVRSGVASLGISGPLNVDVTGIEHIQVDGVDLIPVAAPHDSLAAGRGNAPGATATMFSSYCLIDPN